MNSRRSFFLVGAGLLSFGSPTVSVVLGFPVTLGVLGFVVGLVLLLVGMIFPRASSTKVSTPSPVARFSELLAEEVSFRFGTEGHLHYVSREVEPLLIKRLLDASSERIQVITGEGGAGKTSLLWSLYQTLKGSPGVRPYFISATWLTTFEGSSVLEPSAVLDQLARDTQEGVAPIVLFDTVDVLLHSAESRIQVRSFMDAVVAGNGRLAIASRPAEQEAALFANLGQITRLDRYSEQEMEQAVRILAARFCPGESTTVIDYVRDAMARDLPAREVCERPLLLHMLFELSSPQLPELADVDVTALYRRFWMDRVESDRRFGSGSLADDLSIYAGAVALLMLAAGQPDIPIESARSLLDRELESFSGASKGSHILALEKLAERGVLSVENGRVAFFHQTMFEFAAAQGLLKRGRSEDLGLLIDRVSSAPMDLFVGAVLEQLLVLMVTDRIERDRAVSAIDRLLESSSSPINASVLRVLAHDPQLFSQSVTEVCSVEQLQKFISYSSGLAKIEMTSLLEAWSQIAELNYNRRLFLTLVQGLVRLCARHPELVKRFEQRHDLVGLFLKLDRGAFANPGPVVTLFLLTAGHSEQSTAERVPEIVAATEEHGRGVVVDFLVKARELWSHISSDAVLDAIVEAIDLLVSRNDTDGRTVRQALGRLIFVADPELGDSMEFWRAYSATTAEMLALNEKDLLAGARLYVIIEKLRDCPKSAVVEVAHPLLSMSPFAAPRRIATHFLVPLIEIGGTARDHAIERMIQMLASLPVEPNQPKSVEDQWAIVARIALEDERMIPADIAAATIAYHEASTSLWLSASGLISALAGATVAGVDAALAATVAISADPQVLGRRDRKKYLNEAYRFVENDAVADAYLKLALSNLEFGRITRALVERPKHVAPRIARISILESIFTGLDGAPSTQRAAANLVVQACRVGAIVPSVADAEAMLRKSRHSVARANLFEVLAIAAAEEPEHADEIVDSLRNHSGWIVRDASRPGDFEGNADELALLADKRIDAEVRVSARLQDPEKVVWPRILEACGRRRAVGRRIVEIDLFREANRYLSRLAEHDPSLARTRFLEVGGELRDSKYSAKQVRDVSNMFVPSARVIVAGQSQEGLRELAGSLGELPAPFAMLIVRTLGQLRRREAGALLHSLVSSTKVDPLVKDYIVGSFASAPRRIGTGPFPEVLSRGART